MRFSNLREGVSGAESKEVLDSINRTYQECFTMQAMSQLHPNIARVMGMDYKIELHPNISFIDCT
jgi:hypothetical protein